MRVGDSLLFLSLDEMINDQTTTHTYLSGPEGLFAVVVKEPNGTQYIRYIHTDHLGSWNTITDAGGNRLEELSFDAWGNRRDPNTWRIFTTTPADPFFDRGFTGHEHLYGFQLINMNGRMYDPVVSRMLSPDNFVQAPDFSQSFNRYSYAWNNPLVLTDPSGEIVGFLIAGAIIGAYIGGAYAEGDLNPGNWAWNNNTWKGIIAGGLIGTATGGVIGAMWSAGATISIGANLFGNSVPLISFSQAGFSTANTVAGLIGIGGLGAAGVASIDYSSFNTNKALNEMQSRENLFNQSIGDWNASINQFGAKFTTQSFSNNLDAYNYMWENSFDSKGNPRNEVSAWQTNNSIIVMPYYKNGLRISYNDYLPVKTINGQKNVYYNDCWITITGHIHTHPSYNYGFMGVSDEDYDMREWLNKPTTILWNNGAWQIIGKQNNPLYLGIW